MAEPTTVTPQITDPSTAQQGDSAAQVLEAGEVFTKILDMQNVVFQKQLDGAMKMVTDSMAQLVTLFKDAATAGDAKLDQDSLQQLAQRLKGLLPAVADTKELKDKIPGSLETIMSSLDGIPPADTTQGLSLQQAAELSYLNAVKVQQQMYSRQLDAFTNASTTIIGWVAAALIRSSSQPVH